MTTGSSFDHRPDPELGRALRSVLDGADPVAFRARIMAALPPQASFWDVLAGWTRPGLAAAMLMTALVGYWLVLRQPEAVTATVAAEVAAMDRPISGDGLLGAALDPTR